MPLTNKVDQLWFLSAMEPVEVVSVDSEMTYNLRYKGIKCLCLSINDCIVF